MDDKLKEFINTDAFKKLSIYIKQLCKKQGKKVTNKIILKAFLIHLGEENGLTQKQLHFLLKQIK